MEKEAIIAILQLGLPVALMSWILLSRLYLSGELDPDQDSDEMDDMLEDLGEESEKKRGYIESKWLQFGGGFYGTTAFYTFIVIEFIDIKNFLSDFPGWQELTANGLISLAVDLFVNQITNFVSAMIWFTYWGDEGRTILWVLIAYLGYLAGMQMAKRAAPLAS